MPGQQHRDQVCLGATRNHYAITAFRCIDKTNELIPLL